MPLADPVDAELRRYVIDHAVARIESTHAERDPFPHFTVESFFPDDVYANLLKRLPPPDEYEPFGYEKHHAKDGASNRARFRFETGWLQRLSPADQPFWFSIRSALGSPELKRAAFVQLADGLAFRFRCARSAAGDLEGYALPELFREYAGYRIRPHPDTRKKVVTLQVSLASDRDQTNLGTEFYRRSLRPASWLREPAGFDIARRMPFSPNTAYAFVVLNTVRRTSWHGRTSLPAGCGVRNSLLNIWYGSPEHANTDLIAEHASAS